MLKRKYLFNLYYMRRVYSNTPHTVVPTLFGLEVTERIVSYVLNNGNLLR